MKNNKNNIVALINRLISNRIKKEYLSFLIIFNSFSLQVAILITTESHFFYYWLFVSISYKHLFPVVITICLFGYGSKMNIALVKCHLIIPLCIYYKKKKLWQNDSDIYTVLFIVSRVYYICLSVIIRNWRSAISAYYRITFLVARLLAFMTFFYSLDFFSFFLSCTKVHPAVAAVAAECSLFIHIR